MFYDQRSSFSSFMRHKQVINKYVYMSDGCEAMCHPKHENMYNFTNEIWFNDSHKQ